MNTYTFSDAQTIFGVLRKLGHFQIMFMGENTLNIFLESSVLYLQYGMS